MPWAESLYPTVLFLGKGGSEGFGLGSEKSADKALDRLRWCSPVAPVVRAVAAQLDTQSRRPILGPLNPGLERVPLGYFEKIPLKKGGSNESISA